MRMCSMCIATANACSCQELLGRLSYYRDR